MSRLSACWCCVITCVFVNLVAANLWFSDYNRVRVQMSPPGPQLCKLPETLLPPAVCQCASKLSFSSYYHLRTKLLKARTGTMQLRLWGNTYIMVFMWTEWVCCFLSQPGLCLDPPPSPGPFCLDTAGACITSPLLTCAGITLHTLAHLLHIVPLSLCLSILLLHWALC